MDFKKHKIYDVGILETKLSTKITRGYVQYIQRLLQLINFSTHRAGRILILSNLAKMELMELETTPQVVHCIAI